MFRSELIGAATRLRVKVALGFFAVLPLLMAIALSLSAKQLPADSPPFVASIKANGIYLPLAVLAVVTPLIFPLVVAVLGGDAIAGEADLGTLRYLLAWPTGRSRLVLVKYFVVLTFCLAAASLMVISGLASGAAFFRLGGATSASGSSVPVASAILRTVAAGGIVAAGMASVAAIALFASTLTSSPIGASAAAFAAFILSSVIDGTSQLSAMHPFLFTHYWLSFTNLVGNEAPEGGASSIALGLCVQLAYVTVFLGAAMLSFRRRDVLS